VLGGKLMIDKNHMMACVYEQLAIDYNCEPDDFLNDGLIFTEAKENEGRRPYPFIAPRLEMVTMGHGTIVNVSREVLPDIRKEFEGKTREELFNSPLVYGANSYFLPDFGKIDLIPKPYGFEFIVLEKEDIKNLYYLYGSQYGLSYDENSQIPEMLIILAKCGDEIAGIAKAKFDSRTMWSIDIDVLPLFRGKGLAAPMVNMLTFEILNRGYVPYYLTAASNVLSTHVAVRAGYIPAWVHCYKTRLAGVI